MRALTRTDRRVLIVWRILHAAVASLGLWVVWLGFLSAVPAGTIANEAAQVHSAAVAGATVSGVLLISTLLLRMSGPSAAATWPFAVLWALAIAFWVLLALEASAECRDGLCMPGFDVVFFGPVVAVAVDLAVACSLWINAFGIDPQEAAGT